MTLRGTLITILALTIVIALILYFSGASTPRQEAPFHDLPVPVKLLSPSDE